MIDRSGVCSNSKPQTLGGITWCRVPGTAEVGDDVKAQEAKVEEAARIREQHLNELERGSIQRKLASKRELEMRKAEYEDRCWKRGYDTGWAEGYIKFAHFEFEKE